MQMPSTKKKQKNKDRSVYDDVDAKLKKERKNPKKGGRRGKDFTRNIASKRRVGERKQKKKVSLCFQMPVPPPPPALPSFAKNLCPHHFFFAFLFYFIIYKPESIDATTVVFV